VLFACWHIWSEWYLQRFRWFRCGMSALFSRFLHFVSACLFQSNYTPFMSLVFTPFLSPVKLLKEFLRVTSSLSFFVLACSWTKSGKMNSYIGIMNTCHRFFLISRDELNKIGLSFLLMMLVLVIMSLRWVSKSSGHVPKYSIPSYFFFCWIPLLLTCSCLFSYYSLRTMFLIQFLRVSISSHRINTSSA